MSHIYIICVDDQREVLTTVSKDLAIFEPQIKFEECESAMETMEVLDEIDSQGDYVAVIISDHVMPGKNGVELLTDIKKDLRFSKVKKILLTGLATHQDTITAINTAGIDRYLEKPWKAEELQKNVRELLTVFILDVGINYEKYLNILDQPTLLERLRKRY
ncbi:MAG: response regulator [Bacteroidota bacterium]